ncbi:AAA family ATPase [Acidobacteriota bacterium]
MKLRDGKSLVEETEKYLKSLRKELMHESSPIVRLEMALDSFRKWAAENGTFDTLLDGTIPVLADLEAAVGRFRQADAEKLQLLERIQDFERELDNLMTRNREVESRMEELAGENKKVTERNRKLEETLRFTKEEIAKLREEVQKLKAPPLPYGVYIGPSQNEELIVINVDGKIYEVNIVNEEIKPELLHPGQTLLLNAALNVIDVRERRQVGEVAKVIDSIDENRYIVKSRESEERVVCVASSLKGQKIKAGDPVLYDTYSDLLYELLPKLAVEETVLEEVPNVTYDDIGGLNEQVEQIKDAIELPYIYGHLFKLFQLKPPKGILLYGPPGCGKTLIAKAVANSLSNRIKDFLEENLEAIEVYKLLLDESIDFKDIIPRYDKLRSMVYEYQAIYYEADEKDIEGLYDKLKRSGILGDFLRRTEGLEGKEPSLACNLQDWLDLLIELKEKGFGKCMDKKRIGEMLEAKRKKYFQHRLKVSDREYIKRWLEDYLKNNDIDINNLDGEIAKIKEKLGTGIESYFLNIKGPELLNKYVGETEYRIREVFMRAREKASYGLPVIVFFDEMESMFRTRGSGLSSDVESTIVPQFLTEIDGVESLSNVVVIGASNRQDLIDPAVLRAGRLDIKIRIDRPDKDGARDIFTKYFTADLPFEEEELKELKGNKARMTRQMIDAAVEEMYSTKPENRFLKVIYQNRDEEILFFKDFASGAMIEAIVSRAKTSALKRMILTGRKGIRTNDLLEAIRFEYKENEDLPNTTNPDDWSKISGRKGERIIGIETLMPEKLEKKKETDVIEVSSRYL